MISSKTPKAYFSLCDKSYEIFFTSYVDCIFLKTRDRYYFLRWILDIIFILFLFFFYFLYEMLWKEAKCSLTTGKGKFTTSIAIHFERWASYVHILESKKTSYVHLWKYYVRITLARYNVTLKKISWIMKRIKYPSTIFACKDLLFVDKMLSYHITIACNMILISSTCIISYFNWNLLHAKTRSSLILHSVLKYIFNLHHIIHNYIPIMRKRMLHIFSELKFLRWYFAWYKIMYFMPIKIQNFTYQAH